MPALRQRGELTPTPYWQSECGRAVVYVGDCLEVMARLTAYRSQFHAIITDPPYGLEFMGKEWDAPWKGDSNVNATTRRQDEMDDPVKSKYLRHNVEYGRDGKLYQQWFYDRAVEMLRLAKPGAHLLSFGGTRMWHRMACAIEDAGWEVRDTLMWLYGSGFPKGRDVSKAIDNLLGAERIETDVVKRSSVLGGRLHADNAGPGGYGFGEEWGRSDPVTDEAKQWQGWNTALKPAWEPVIMARRPLPAGKSVEQNTLNHGCGGINVDDCRVGTTGETVEKLVPTKTSTGSGVYGFNKGEAGDVTMNGGFTTSHKDGRHPANVLHDGSADATSGLPDGACRYFYTSKANDDDRPHGKGATVHPTVKPLDLMRYLVRLVCAKGGTVLDPFMGSGSTGCAAIEEGDWFVGVEQSQEYADIAIGRLRLALEGSGSAVRLETGERVERKRRTPHTPERLRG